jgi:hypothetical protein
VLSTLEAKRFKRFVCGVHVRFHVSCRVVTDQWLLRLTFDLTVHYHQQTTFRVRKFRYAVTRLLEYVGMTVIRNVSHPLQGYTLWKQPNSIILVFLEITTRICVLGEHSSK